MKEITIKEELNEKFYLKENDIIMKMFAPFHSLVITKEYEGILVLANMEIIRVNNKQVDINYFSFCLRSLYYDFKNHNVLSNNLKLETLINFDIDLPSLQKQKQICKLMNSFEKQKSLLNQKKDLIDKKERYYFNEFSFKKEVKQKIKKEKGQSR